MRVGEKAILRCAPAYAYGAAAQDKIPANSTLNFEVEMLSWTPPAKSRSDMTTHELVAGSTKDKDAGNELFKQGDFTGALRKYSDALTWHKHVYQEKEKATPLEVVLLINSAACNLKLGQFSGTCAGARACGACSASVSRATDAIENCTKALKLDAKNVKAYHRRAQALIGKGISE
jgi:tetratricopeptide (TPR) repeat protein